MALKIDIENYRIYSDTPRQITVGKINVDKKGNEFLSDQSYFPTLALAATYLRSRFALSESINTLDEMNEVYERTTKDIVSELGRAIWSK